MRKLGGLVRRIKRRGGATRTEFRDRSQGRRWFKQISRTPRRRTGQAPAEIDRLTGEIASIARRALGQAPQVARNARRALGSLGGSPARNRVLRPRHIGASSDPRAAAAP